MKSKKTINESVPALLPWLIAETVAEEVIIEVPQKFEESINWQENNERKYVFASADYRKYFNGVFYFIFSDKSDSISISNIPNLSEPLKSFVDEFDKEPETLKFGDFNGIKYEFKDSEDFYHTIIFVRTNQNS